MRNLKTILLILFAIVIVILVFFLVKNIKNNNNTSKNDKIVSEINYIDSKITSLLNDVNNIDLDSNRLSITKTSTEQSNQSEQSEQSEETPEKYELKPDGVLQENLDIDWDEIKNEVELLYTIIPTMTLDLYILNINQEEILSFNNELDELTIAVKNEDKEKTLVRLANLYRYLPVYASKSSNDNKYISLLETKLNVFKAYVFVNIDNWEEANNNIGKAIESYSRNLNNIQNNNNDTNKLYIILNEIQNAINIKDKDVFFIKYKNFLEKAKKTT